VGSGAPERKGFTVDGLVIGGVGWRLVPFVAGNWRWEDGAESLKSGDNEKPRLRLSIIQTDLAAKERKERTEKAKSLMAKS